MHVTIFLVVPKFNGQLLIIWNSVCIITKRKQAARIVSLLLILLLSAYSMSELFTWIRELLLSLSLIVESLRYLFWFKLFLSSDGSQSLVSCSLKLLTLILLRFSILLWENWRDYCECSLKSNCTGCLLRYSLLIFLLLGLIISFLLSKELWADWSKLSLKFFALSSLSLKNLSLLWSVSVFETNSFVCTLS